MEAVQQQSNLELSGERSVSFTDRGQALTYVFRTVTAQDWKNFFAGMVLDTKTETIGSETVRTDRFDFKSAGLDLVEASLLRVHGYTTQNGQSIESLPNWKQRLPYNHRLRAAALLQEVAVSQSAREFVIYAETEEVVLRAKWGAQAPGVMFEYDGLVHRFTPASVEQQRRYTRAMSESRVVRDKSGSVRTVYPMRQGLLMELYDELVHSVDGYAVAGERLSSQSEAIRQSMDGMHKVVAVQQIFDSVTSERAA